MIKHNKCTENKLQALHHPGHPLSSEYDEVCPVNIQPCIMKNRDIYQRRYKEHCTQDNDASVPFKVGTLGPHTGLPASLPLFKTLCKILCWNRHQLPCRIFLTLIDSLKSLPFQRCFQFQEKLEVSGCKVWAVGGLSHPGDLMYKLCTRHEGGMSGTTVVKKLPITRCPQLWLFSLNCIS